MMRSTTGARQVVAAATLSLLVLAAGCSGGDDGASMTSEDRVTGDELGTGDGVATGEGRDTGDGLGPVGEGEQASGDDAGHDDTATESGDATIDGGTAIDGQHIIREVSVRLASDEPEATVEAIHRAATAAGGFVASEDLHRQDGVLSGTVVVRVPTTELPAALTQIEASGTELVDRQRSSQDVTLEVTDVTSQLRNLRALETELLDLLSDARESGDTGQVLTVFDRVRSVRDEIERLDGRRTTLADRVALATITVHVEPTGDLLAATASERDPRPGPWDPRRRAALAWRATVGGLQTLADVLIVVVITLLPLVLLWTLPIGALVLLARRWRRRRPTSPTAPPAPPPAQPARTGSVPSATDVDED